LEGSYGNTGYLVNQLLKGALIAKVLAFSGEEIDFTRGKKLLKSLW
jgi:hypothetical protein